MTDLVAPITDVTVYANRALITRVGSIQLEAGEHELRVNDLPKFLKESLRTSGKGPQGTRILDVDITTTFYARPPESELQTMQAACDLLQQEIDLLRARQEALEDRRQWLRSLGEQSRDFSRGLARGEMKPQDCADFFQFTAQQALKNAEDALDLETQLKQKREALAARQRELAQKQGYNLPDRLSAVISVFLPSAGELTLELSYLVTQASWQPRYDVRVVMDQDGNQGEVELTYTGLVQQATGENWQQVRLALSTARPTQAAVLPELQPLYLRVPVYLPRTAPMGQAMAPAAAPAPMAMPKKSRSARTSFGGSDDETAPSLLTVSETEAEELDLAPQASLAEVAVASAEQSGTAYVFRVGHSVDIPSDKSPHKTTIARDSLPCTFDYVSAPAIEQNVHLRARVTNTTERVLLPGESSIFLNGEYVGTTSLKMTAPREQFKIFLGIDDNLKVKRERIERAVEKGALLQGDLRRITYAYRLTVHNYASFPRNLVLRDQLPVSQHERVRVKNQTIQPVPTERTKLELLTWRATLPADGEYQVDYRFTVEHPQDINITGLPE